MRAITFLLALLSSCALGQGIPTAYSSGIPMRDGGYGASADLGWTNDPTTDATAYNAGTIYSTGDMVSSAGTYYISEKDANVGNALTDVTAWWQVNQVCYVAAAGSDTTPISHCNTNPATAKASPLQTLAGVYAVTGSGGAPPHTLILFNRGETFTGAVLLQGVLAATNFGSTGIVGNGTTATVTTTTPHWLVSGMTPTISGSTNFNGTTSAVTVIDSTHFSFSSATTATDGPNTSIKLAYNYGNFRFGAYGTGARPVLTYRDNNAIGNKQALFWTNKSGWRAHNIVFDSDYTVSLTATALASPSDFANGATITDQTSGATGTLVYERTADKVYQVKQTNISASFAAGHVISDGTNTATIASNGVVQSGVFNTQYPDWKLQNSEVRNAPYVGFVIGNGTAGTGNDIFILNSSIHDTCTNTYSGAGISGGGGTVHVLHSSIYNNGNSVQAHGFYDNNNTLTDFQYNYVANNSGSGYNQHGLSTNVTVAHNWFDRNSDACIGMNGNYVLASGQRNVKIYDNICSNSGHGRVDSTSAMGLYLNNIVDADIYNNLIAGNYGDGIRLYRNNNNPAPHDSTANVNIVGNTIVVPVAGSHGPGTVGSSSFASALNIDDTTGWTTVTISIANPGVVSYTGHLMSTNDPVVFKTTGAMPSPLVAGTPYYVIYVNANSFQLAASPGGAAIETTGTQSGTQSISMAAFPITGINIVSNVLVNLGNSNTNYTDYIGYANIINTGFLEANNLHYAPNKPDGKPIYWNGSTYTLANFQAAAIASSGAHSQGYGDVLGDPLFVGGSGWYDYRIQAGSPAKAMGSSVTCFVSGLPCPTTDLAGQARGTPPSAGAYQ